jgi:HPr kinase/phosphorylase
MTSLPIHHATSVVFCGHGLLLRGKSGSGKSDLALRIMDAGGSLISDDYTQLSVRDGKLFGAPPESIQGLIEVRGVGLLEVPHLASAQLDAVIECESLDEIERLPPLIHTTLEGVKLPLLMLYPFESSAVAKLRAFLQSHLTSVKRPLDNP